MTDWREWHKPYDDPSSDLSRRRRVVQDWLADALDQRQNRATIVSLCSGDGADVIEVLANRDSANVRALLVENDAGLVQTSQRLVEMNGLSGCIEVRHGDAGDMSHYSDHVPAQIILACGVFGNISPEDVTNTISKIPQLTEPGGTVIWTRGRKTSDHTPIIRAHFERYGFTEVAFVAPNDASFSVGGACYRGQVVSFEPTQHLFTFVK